MADTPQKKILIVEDEPDAQKIYLDILQAAGFYAKGANNGKEALAALEAEKFDLVLLDIIMP